MRKIGMKQLMQEWRAFELATIVEQQTSRAIDQALPDNLKGNICAGNQLIKWKTLKKIIMDQGGAAADALGLVDKLRDKQDLQGVIEKQTFLIALKTKKARDLIVKGATTQIQAKLNADELKALLVPQVNNALAYSGTAVIEELPDPKKYAVDSIVSKAFNVISSEKYLKPRLGKLLLAVADNIESSGQQEYDAWINQLDKDLAKLIVQQTKEQGSLVEDIVKVMVATKVFSYNADELLSLMGQQGKAGKFAAVVLGNHDDLKKKRGKENVPAFEGLDAVTKAAIEDLGIKNRLETEGLCGFLNLYEELDAKKWGIQQIESTFPQTWDALVSNNSWLAALGRNSSIIKYLKNTTKDDKQAMIDNTERGQKVAQALLKKVTGADAVMPDNTLGLNTGIA